MTLSMNLPDRRSLLKGATLGTGGLLLAPLLEKVAAAADGKVSQATTRRRSGLVAPAEEVCFQGRPEPVCRNPEPAAKRSAMKSARRLSFLFALVASALAAGFPAAKAEEPAKALPADTNAIERLTPEQARRLAADFPGAEQEIIVRGSSPAIFYEALPLNRLRVLDAATARALAGYGKEPLVLNGLTTLDAAAAKALAEYKGALLVLNGLTELDAAAARALVEYKGGLILNGLTALDAATAKALAEFRGKWLGLGGLAGLDADAAQALAAVTCEMMDLSGLRTLGAEAARMLAGLRTPNLVINGLPTLDAASARALADFKGQHLELGGLESLDADAARALATSKAWDGRFLKLTTLNAPTAEALAERAGNSLMFDRLAALDADTAQALAAFKGNLFLQSLMTLDLDVAQALATSKSSMLVFGSLAKVDPDIVRAFGEYAGMLGVGQEVVERFVAMHPLSPENARGIASLSNGVLKFVTALDSPDCVDIAKALAARKGRLELNGLTTLSAEAATALAQHEGRSLSLPGLTTLSDEAAKALAQYKGDLSLASISFSLTPDSALVWATLLQGQLSAVTALDSPDAVAIAKALATRKGPLSLPNLKKISPKTLSALIEKEDIDIPLIETLELIPEPDGSPTEDFVIPEGFQQRQQR